MNNTKIILALLITAFISACASNTSNKQSNSILFNEYQRYSALLNHEHKNTPVQLENIFAYFSVRKQNDLLSSRAKSSALLQELVTDYLSFPVWVSKPLNHFEHIDDKNACFLINGYTEKKEPIAININYEKSANWKIDEVHVEYLAPFNKFLDKAICSRKIRDEIRFKEMM